MRTPLSSERYPHTLVSKLYRYRIAEARDLMFILGTDYMSKAAWYTVSKDPSGTVERVNEARKSLFETIPYVGRCPAKDDDGDGMSDGERLMWKLIEADKARKAREEAGKE